MSAEQLLVAALAAPILQALACAILARAAAMRDLFALGGVAVTTWAVFTLASQAAAGDIGAIAFAEPAPGLALAFAAEPVSAAFACVAMAALAPLTVFTVGFLRASEDAAPARLSCGIALCGAGLIGCAFSANLLTFFVCYTALALASAPVIAHGRDAERARRVRLAMTTVLGLAAGLLLPAVTWAHALVGPAPFEAAGALGRAAGPAEASALMTLFTFGLGAGALMPLHRWAAASIHAPAPAGACALACGLSLAGVFGFLKIVVFVFGPATMVSLPAAPALAAFAFGSAVLAALIGLAHAGLRPRIAYLFIAHLGLAVGGALLGAPAAMFGAVVQLAAFAFAGTTLLMALGLAEHAWGRALTVRDEGLGRLMPFTFAAFMLAALALAGAPPLAGAWSKMWLVAGAGEVGAWWAIAATAGSAVFTFAALAPFAVRALAAPPPGLAGLKPDAGSLLLAAPIAAGGLLAVGLFFVVDPLSRFVGPALAGGAP